jgi:uncharacterized protein (UPF0332 family)
MNRKEETIRLKLLKSQSLLAEVEVLMAHKFYVSAISRLYYSCFHATKALLLTKDLLSKTHSGTINQLHQHFVLAGLFDPVQATFFSRLMQERIDDDYSDFMIISEDEVREYIQPAKEYITYIEHLIESYFQQNKSELE